MSTTLQFLIMTVISRDTALNYQQISASCHCVWYIIDIYVIIYIMIFNSDLDCVFSLVDILLE